LGQYEIQNRPLRVKTGQHPTFTQYRREKMPEQSPRYGNYPSGDDPNPSLRWADCE
jgi:hypothetical protein